MTDERVEQLLARVEITDVVYRYCRGIDRRDFDLVRSCYHPGAVEDHGDYVGDVPGFVERAARNLARCERTMHVVGNVLVEFAGASARCESYALAFHRLPSRGDGRPARDRVVGLRYLDVFARRDGRWLIASRRCLCEWTRTDPVARGFDFPPDWLRGHPGPEDAVFDESWRGALPTGSQRSRDDTGSR